MKLGSSLCTLALVIGFAYSPAALAEGGSCPPGSYPVGGRGASGCAAIPGAGQGGQDDTPPMPAQAKGRWYERYGAIMQSESTSVVGVAADNETPQGALAEAGNMCGAEGAKDCKVVITYYNQCVAWLLPSADVEGNMSGYAKGKTAKDAEKNAAKYCKDVTGKKCKVFYSACSLPKFEKF